MSDLSVPVTFITGQVVSAADFNSDYAAIVSYVNGRNSGASTWDAMYSTSASAVPLVANNSTGVQDIANFYDDSVLVGQIYNGGIVSFSGQDFAYGTVGGIVPASSTAKLTLSSIVSQTHSSMDGTGKFTAQEAGKYLVFMMLKLRASGFVGPNTTGTPQIYKNGALFSSSTCVVAISSAFKMGILADVLSLSDGDYVEAYLTAGSGASSVSSNVTSYFFIHKLS